MPAYNVSHAGARELMQEIQRECPAVAERASEFLAAEVRVAPTLMKYAEPSPYEIETRRDLTAAAAEMLAAIPSSPRLWSICWTTIRWRSSWLRRCSTSIRIMPIGRFAKS